MKLSFVICFISQEAAAERNIQCHYLNQMLCLLQTRALD